MRKFLSCVICAILAISSMIVSVSAAETENAASGDSYRDEFINALMSEENVWINSDIMKSEIQFIDLNFDGKKEFVVQYYGNGTVHGSDIYCLDGGSVRKIENDNSGMIVQTESLKGYYDSTAKSYKMFGSYSKSEGYIGDLYYYNFELLYNTDNQSLKTNVYSRYELKRGTDASDDTTTYYSADDKSITEEEYNSINTEVTSGLNDINLKFEFEDVRNYTPLSTSEKKAMLERLYDSSTYDEYDKVAPEPVPESKPEPTTDNTNKNDNTNNESNKNTNTNNTTSTDNTVKSPKTGVVTNVDGIFTVLFASGAAIVIASKKRKEDI